MIGELSDIDNLLENRSLDEIDRYIQGLRVETYDYKHTLNLPLYRARYAEGFDINNPEQFSYNHYTDCIKRHRYNKEKEAVLFTATNPLVAFKEIKEDGKPDSFYLAVWKPRNKTHEFNLALNLNGSVVPMNSNAGRFNRILKIIQVRGRVKINTFQCWEVSLSDQELIIGSLLLWLLGF